MMDKRNTLLGIKVASKASWKMSGILTLIYVVMCSPLCFSQDSPGPVVGFYRVGEVELPVEPGLKKAVSNEGSFDSVSVDELDVEVLKGLDVIVLFPAETGNRVSAADAALLGEWVKGGKGLMCMFTTVSDDSGNSLAPGVAALDGLPCADKPDYEIEEGCVASDSGMAGEGAVKDRHLLRGFDYASLKRGDAGRVLFRSVLKKEGKAVSSTPLLVAGGVGKGRCAAYGAKPASAMPVGIEKSILLNVVKWLAGGPETLTVSDDIGEGVELGAVGVDYAVNGGAETEPSSGDSPPGWTTQGRGKEYLTVTLSTNAFSGKHSVCVSVPALGEGESAGRIQAQPCVVNGDVKGPDKRDLYAMPPGTRYTVSYMVKGSPENKTRPMLNLSFYAWPQNSEKPIGIPRNKNVVVYDKWVRHSFDFYCNSEVAQGCMVQFRLGPGAADNLHPNSTAYIDDVSITRSYGGIPKGLSFESVLAGCEEHVKVDWTDSMSSPALELENVPAGTPVEFPEKLLARPVYNPLPDGWKELDLCGEWKIRKLHDTGRNPPDDQGTVEGFWKAEYDDSNWSLRTVPSHWHHEDKPDPEGLTGWGYRGYRLKPIPDPEVFEGVGWYRYRCDVPADFKGERTVLVFEGVDWEANVFVNGVEVGKDTGFDAPVEFDVTDQIKPGAENVIAVRLYDTAHRTWVDQNDAVGGLFNRVVLQTRPSVYVSRMLINPRLEKSCCEIDLSLTNSTGTECEIDLKVAVTPDPNQKGCVRSEGKAFDVNLGKHKLKPGLNEMTVTVPMENAVRWSCDDPFLYILQFKNGDEVIGKERFGYRDFKQVGRFLYLNGERVYLVGGPAPVFDGITCMELWNRNNIIRRAILARKQLHHNCFIARNSMQTSIRQMYDACDELGILLYDWSGDIWNYEWPEDDWGGSRWFYWRYNHPCVVIYTLSNEVRTSDQLIWINKLYHWVKDHDRQGRPVCTTTGGEPKLLVPDTDIADVHLYPGDIADHPLDMLGNIYYFNWRVWKKYHRNMPVLCYEMGANHIVAVPDRVKIGRALLKDEPVNYRHKLARMIRAQMENYDCPTGMRWLSLYGMRRYCIDDYDDALKRGVDPDTYGSEMPCRRQAWCVKHLTDSCRRAGDLLQGFGYNWQVYNAFSFVDPSKPDHREMSRGWSLKLVDKTMVATPCFNVYKRVCNPCFVCLNALFDRDVFSGGKLNATVYAINDTARDSAPWTVRIIVKDKAGKRLSDSSAPVGTVPSFKRKLIPYEWSIPEDLATGFYEIELFLLDGKNVVSDNSDKFFVMNRADLVQKVDVNGKKVAVYDSLKNAEKLNGITTRSILDGLNFEYDRIDGFDSLANYDVLIIGARSVDDVVAEAGKAITEWVGNGGRMLVYEQVLEGHRPGAIPFFPQLSYRRGNGVIGDVVAYHHPIFEGIRAPENWEKWNLNHRLFYALISSLNRTMLATGCWATPRYSNDAVEMLISEVREGDGIILMSQPEATSRYGNDCVATRYIQNTLKYIVSDDSRYAQSLDGFEIVNIDRHRCGYLDISEYAELEPEDISPEFRKELDSGFKSCGGLAFKTADGNIISAEKATMELLGDVVLDMKTTSKYMYPEWEAEKQKRDKNQLGLGKNRPEAVYILHRGVGMGEREIVGSYNFRYADGTVVKEEIIGDLNIAPPGKKTDLSGAKAVGDGFYVCRWVNPSPEKELESITIEMTSDSAELQVAGITTYLIRLEVHD